MFKFFAGDDRSDADEITTATHPDFQSLGAFVAARSEDRGVDAFRSDYGGDRKLVDTSMWFE